MNTLLKFTIAVLFCLIASSTFAAPGELALTPDPPFKTYSLSDGLNQRGALRAVQDQQGFLWVSSFGGLNRFDGANFESFTTRQGLRENFIQNLLVDDRNRIWAGDASGGLTVIENSKVVRTIEPPEGHPAIVRTMLQVGDTLYIGTEPAGLRRVSMSDPLSVQEFISEETGTISGLVQADDSDLFIVSSKGMFRFKPEQGDALELVSDDLTAVGRSARGEIYVGDVDGRVGRWTDNGALWLEHNYGAEIHNFAFQGEKLVWVFAGDYFAPFEHPDRRLSAERDISPRELLDDNGVLWLTTSEGLRRYLGPRFEHYSLNIDGVIPAIYSIASDAKGGFWFGSHIGLLHVDNQGVLTETSKTLGLPSKIVRDIKLSQDQKTLWVAHIEDIVYRVDTDAMTASPAFPNEPTVTMGLELDGEGRVWAGSYFGGLYVYDPSDGSTRSFELGKGSSIYSLSLARNGWLWFTVNHKGIYRINTTLPNAEPELVIETENIGSSLFTQIVVNADATGVESVWFATVQGGVFQWAEDRLQRVIDNPAIADLTIYSISPLSDNTVVLTTSKGAYRYDRKNDYLEHYGALEGFLAIEGSTHASYVGPDGSLWLGTSSGVTRMDVSIPMSGTSVPKPMISRVVINDEAQTPKAGQTVQTKGGKVVVEYAAISLSNPDGIEYSYKLKGTIGEWSLPTKNRSIEFSSLTPGNYNFLVRARIANTDWSAPATWSFNVPTPFWHTYWFIVLALLLGLLLVRSIIRFRLRSIAKANRRLRKQVLERTQSIEAGRRELEISNSQLIKEIKERQRSDELRADVEARFHQAYQNSPIGMALVNADGLVYDANPRLKALFWPDSEREDKEPLISVIVSNDHDRFVAFLDSFVANKLTEPSMEFECLAHNGDIRNIDFLPSAVRGPEGSLQYLVLLANDVTESNAMTRQLEYQARFDELTGLLNRRAYTAKLKSVSKNATHANSAYLLFMDLDRFKVVNDTCGHAAGDELLRKVAKLITFCVRDDDTVARLGGDEFALIFLKCSQDIAMERAEQIRQLIEELEFIWDSQVFRIGVSIGVVPFGLAVEDLSELQQLADAACYAAKAAGRNRVHLVAGDQDAALEHRGEMRWVQKINHAIDTNSFVLYGQRIVSLENHDSQQEHIEVLLRMHDRESNRLIPPGAFLPAAERYGLQGMLDQWVVKRVIEMLQEQDPVQLEKCQFWVNLSGASVSDENFSRKLIETVAACDVPSGALNFEITETTAIRKVDAAAKLVSELQRMGCKVALDDFGSGLSSFSYLKRLNVDVVKVEGEYVRDILNDPIDRVFVKFIIDLAHTLDMKIVAEFVETEDLCAAVKELGADFAQGFGIHRPQPLNELVVFVDNGQVAEG